VVAAAVGCGCCYGAFGECGAFSVLASLSKISIARLHRAPRNEIKRENRKKTLEHFRDVQMENVAVIVPLSITGATRRQLSAHHEGSLNISNREAVRQRSRTVLE